MSESQTRAAVLPPEEPADARELAAARKRRSLALAWGLFLFVALVFAVTIARLGGNVFNAP